MCTVLTPHLTQQLLLTLCCVPAQFLMDTPVGDAVRQPSGEHWGNNDPYSHEHYGKDRDLTLHLPRQLLLTLCCVPAQFLMDTPVGDAVRQPSGEYWGEDDPYSHEQYGKDRDLTLTQEFDDSDDMPGSRPIMTGPYGIESTPSPASRRSLRDAVPPSQGALST